ncbi:hypothetical protein [Actinospongicola halichondriae]|uniref:hypothetical protein n=1 Tax=Actinospongicola halichondriae TaxID=3236844 RepID=UPI003D3BD4C7
MSNRHRSSKQAAPSAAHPAPNKEQRRAENRRARHRTHELLAHADTELGEELVPPRPHHTRVDIDPKETTIAAASAPTSSPGREYRHWKQKFWKRRTNIRAAKARLAAQEPPLPELG